MLRSSETVVEAREDAKEIKKMQLDKKEVDKSTSTLGNLLIIVELPNSIQKLEGLFFLGGHTP